MGHRSNLGLGKWLEYNNKTQYLGSSKLAMNSDEVLRPRYQLDNREQV